MVDSPLKLLECRHNDVVQGYPMVDSPLKLLECRRNDVVQGYHISILYGKQIAIITTITVQPFNLCTL